MTRMGEKINDIFGNGEGIAGWIVLSLFSFINGYGAMFGLIIFVTIVDAIWGVVVAVKQGKFLLSDLMRRTINKILAYSSIFLVLIATEKIVHFEGVCSSIVVAVISLTELWSICGNLLILYPNLAFLRLLRPALKGEIGRKLGIDEQQVEDALDKKKSHKKKTENE